jgi:hypothetical protein
MGDKQKGAEGHTPLQTHVIDELYKYNTMHFEVCHQSTNSRIYFQWYVLRNHHRAYGTAQTASKAILMIFPKHLEF